MSAQLLQFAGSLVAIGALVALVHWLRAKDGLATVRDEAVQQAIDDIFGPVPIAKLVIDKAGRAALALAMDGRAFVLKRHGAHWAGRELSALSQIAVESEHVLVIDSTERRFGIVRLTLDDAQDWVRHVSAL